MTEQEEIGLWPAPRRVVRLVALRTTLARLATAVAGLITHSAVLVLMLFFVALHSIIRGFDPWFRHGRVDREQPPGDLVVVALALVGLAAWAISRLAEWKAGEQAGPGLALLLMIYATLMRDALRDRLTR